MHPKRLIPYYSQSRCHSRGMLVLSFYPVITTMRDTTRSIGPKSFSSQVIEFNLSEWVCAFAETLCLLRTYHIPQDSKKKNNQGLQGIRNRPNPILAFVRSPTEVL